MYFVYLLQSELDNSLYIGFTTGIKQRLVRHNSKQVISTKNKAPWKLVFFEAFNNSADAKNRERYLKSGWGRRTLATMLKESFNKS